LFKNKKFLFVKAPHTATTKTDVNTEFKGHIHSENFIPLCCLAPGKVMDRILRTSDHIDDLVETIFAGF